jgi:REG-2-like HAD superfamily hydrolase
VNGNGLSAVSFDAGNTLLYCDPSPSEIYAEHLSRHGRAVSADDVGPVFKSAWAEMQRRTATGRDRYSSVSGGERAWWGGFVREVLRQLDHDAPWEVLLEDLYAAFSDSRVWKVFDDTPIALDALEAAGVRRAVISNWDRRLPEILDTLRLSERFEVVTVSSLEGVEKPARGIFERTLDRLGLAADAVLHVGDSPLEDYAGASAAGLNAVLLDRRGLFSETEYRRVASLEELVELVQNP